MIDCPVHNIYQIAIDLNVVLDSLNNAVSFPVLWGGHFWYGIRCYCQRVSFWQLPVVCCFLLCGNFLGHIIFGGVGLHQDKALVKFECQSEGLAHPDMLDVIGERSHEGKFCA